MPSVVLTPAFEQTNGTANELHHVAESTSHDGIVTQGDSIPTHALGVKPLGNRYLSKGPNAKASSGNWGILPDEMVMLVLEQMDARSLLSLGSTYRWTEQPFILTKCIQEWPVMSEWTIERLLHEYRGVEFRAEAVDWTMERYCEYMKDNKDESPLYLFDRKFAEKMGISVGHRDGAAYWRPGCFGPDLFEVLGDERPAHRWLIIGPERSGSTFHKDPNGTSAWNAVIQGSKYWIMFPPNAQVPGVYVSDDSSEVTSPLSIAEWLLTFHKEARQLPECIEGVCHTGEILHVPSGWWHLVVNLESGIALTQNFVPQSPGLNLLSEVLLFMRDKADQVSGFDCNVDQPYQLFRDRLGQKYPDVLDRALELADKKSGKKRKWDAVIGKEAETEGLGGGFSFGFGSDDDNDVP